MNAGHGPTQDKVLGEAPSKGGIQNSNITFGKAKDCVTRKEKIVVCVCVFEVQERCVCLCVVCAGGLGSPL